VVWLYVGILVALFGAFWASQFSFLMLLAQGQFPGRRDKVLWVFAFIFMPLFTPFAFLAWRQARQAVIDQQDS